MYREDFIAFIPVQCQLSTATIYSYYARCKRSVFPIKLLLFRVLSRQRGAWCDGYIANEEKTDAERIYNEQFFCYSLFFSIDERLVCIDAGNKMSDYWIVKLGT